MKNTSDRKVMLAGPWIGEFGWEVMCFQATVRACAKDNEFDYVVIGTRKGNKFLYEDIVADGRGEVIEFDFPVDQINMWRNDGVDLNSLVSSGKLWDLMDCKWLKPDDYMPERTKLRADYISYKQHRILTTCIPTPTVLVHVRNAQHSKSSFRNWPINHAKRVVEKMIDHGLPVASIGLRATSLHVPGTLDLRGVDLDLLSHVMSTARMLVGPLSGPTHFAALCGLPQVVWVTHIHHEIRVRQTWNPFNIPVTVLRAPSDTYWRKRKLWIPDVDTVVNATFDAIGGKMN